MRVEALHVRVLNEDQWHAIRDSYQALLSRSRADPLFNSPDWQELWWRHLPRSSGDERLSVHAAYDGTELVGALSVVSGKVRRRGLAFRSAQLAGSRLFEQRGAVSEYLDVVAVDGREDEVRAACLRSVARHERCSEFVVGWSAASAAWVEAIGVLPRRRWSYVRILDSLTSYQADLGEGFDRYLAALSGNARRSLFNLRRKLSERGEVRVARVPDDRIEHGLREMNRLHAMRWGTPALSRETLRVHEDLIARWSGTDRVQLSSLEVAGRTVSMLYDLRLGTTQYNIQMGFDPNFDASVSLGLLHLGYAMEQAAREGVRTYDFLAGSGRSTDYKRRIATQSRQIATVQYLSDPLVATAFRWYDAARRRRSRADRSTI